MYFFSLAKSGAGLVPVYYLGIYLVFVGLDIYTTYIGTPDLKYEKNWIIRLFNLRFREIIPLAFLFTLTVSYLSLISAAYLTREIREKSGIQNRTTFNFLKSDRKVVLSTIILMVFYSHLIISVFVTFNNYLNYVYLYNKENIFSQVAYSYVKFESIFSPNYYLYTSGLLILAGSSIAYLKISRLLKDH